MNNKQLILLSLFCVGSQLNAETTQNDDAVKTTFELSQGYRRDKLDLKIARGSGKNFYHSKDQFKDVDVYTSRLAMTVRKNDFFLKGVAGYGNVYDGKLHRSSHYKNITYAYDAHKSSHITGDYTADFSLTFGRDFFLANDWSIAPTIGYGVYIQDFHTSRGKFRLRDNQKDKDHGRGTKEKFKATWYSPQLGFNVRKAITSTLSAYANYAFLFPLNYHANAHYNTRNKKGSHYEQENKAFKSFGNIGTVGLDWNFAKNWSLKPEFELMKFYSKGGDSAHQYRFKKAHRTATEYRLVLGYTF